MADAVRHPSQPLVECRQREHHEERAENELHTVRVWRGEANRDADRAREPEHRGDAALLEQSGVRDRLIVRARLRNAVRIGGHVTIFSEPPIKIA